MRKIPKQGIVLGILLVVVVLGFGCSGGNGSAGTTERTSATTIVSTTPATTEIPQVSFMPAQAGGTGNDKGYGVSVTSDGGAIITGSFGGTVIFGSTTLTSNGELDVFVGKISAAGVWEWVTSAGGTGQDRGLGVSVTSDGGAIITGYSSDTASFGSTTLISNDDTNTFVGKISADGEWVWVTPAGGTGVDAGFGVSVTSDGGAIVTGSFAGTNTFGATTLTSTGGENLFVQDVFVGKISAAGVWEWATSAGGTEGDVGLGVSVTSDGGAIITGSFGGTVTFGSTTLTSSGGENLFVTDVFVGKISADGVWEWATSAGGTEGDLGLGVSVMSDGGAIVTGMFAGTNTFGQMTLTSSGGDDAFVGKISAAGVWQWVTPAGGTGQDKSYGVSVTSDGGAIITGYSSDTASFGSMTLTSSGGDDAFVGKISADGVWEWANPAGSTGVDAGFGVSVTSDGGAIITGSFGGTVTFGATTLTSSGGEDVFVAKISSTGVWNS